MWPRFCLPVLAVVCGLSAANLARALPPYEETLPSDTILVFSIRDVSELKQEFFTHTILGLIKEPAMQPFYSGVGDEILKLVAQAEIELTRDPEWDEFKQCLSLPTGQLTVGIALDRSDRDSDGDQFFLLDCKGKEDDLKRLLDQALAKEIAKGIGSRREGDIYVFESDPNEADPEDEEEDEKEKGKINDFTAELKRETPFCCQLVGSVLVGGDSPANVQKLKGYLTTPPEKSLATDPTYQSFRNVAGAKGDVEFFFNLEKILKLAEEEMKKEDPPTSLEEYGLNGLSCVGASLSFGDGEMAMKTQLVCLRNGPAVLFDYLWLPSVDLTPEKWVPASIVTYRSVSFDLKRICDAFAKLEWTPAEIAEFKEAAVGPDPSDPIFDVRLDFVEAFGNRITILSDLVEERGFPSERSLYAWEIKNPTRVKRLVDRLIGMVPEQAGIVKKTVKGQDVYALPLRDLIFESALDPNEAKEVWLPFDVIGVTVTKTHIMLATHDELLDQVLTTDAGWTESPEYDRVARYFPAKCSAVSYANSQRQMRALWDLVRGGKPVDLLREGLKADPDIGGVIEQAAGPLLESLSGKNLPSFDVVKKYFHNSGGYIVIDEQGLRVAYFTLENN